MRASSLHPCGKVPSSPGIPSVACRDVGKAKVGNSKRSWLSAIGRFARAPELHRFWQSEQQLHQRFRKEVKLLNILGSRLRRIMICVIAEYTSIIGPLFHVSGQHSSRCKLVDPGAELSLQFGIVGFQRQLEGSPEAHCCQIQARASVRFDGLEEYALRFGRNVVRCLRWLFAGEGLRNASDGRVDSLRAADPNGGVKIWRYWRDKRNAWHLATGAEQVQGRHSCRSINLGYDVEREFSSAEWASVHEGCHV